MTHDETTDDYQAMPPTLKTVNRVCFLDCKEGVTTGTILSMFGVFFTNFSFSSYVFYILIFFLEDPKTFSMSPEKALSTAAWLLCVCYPFNLVSSLFSGYLFVRFGRRNIILTGFLLGISSCMFVPFMSYSIYPNLFLVIVMVNIGTAWTQNPPLIADYVKPNSIGKAYAIQGLLTFTATIFAVAVLFGTTKDLDFEVSVPIVCAILYSLTFLSACGLKEIKSSQTELVSQDGQE